MEQKMKKEKKRVPRKNFYNIEEIIKDAGIQASGVYKRIRKLKIKTTYAAGVYSATDYDRIINFDTKKTGKRVKDREGNFIKKWGDAGERNFLEGVDKKR